MRVPVSWLREFVPWEASPEELAERLTSVGVAVEAVERSGLAAARIAAVEPLPGSDHLQVCRLEGGAQVVSGAPGIAAGQSVAWAKPGAVLPDGRRIARAAFLGVESEGMLCSAAELALPGGHAGLLDASDARLGLDDAVLVLELTPNYALHCQSILGVARELAALSGLPLPAAAPHPAESARPAAGALRVALEAADRSPLYLARVVENLAVGPSPAWLCRRLQLCGMRPVNNVVDVTNYVLLELGQPLHAFDRRQVRQGRIVVRLAAPGEELATLDGVRRRLTADDLVIADAERGLAVAGVMGGEGSEVCADTTAVVLESAWFSPEGVGRTARRLGLRTEAAVRFMRGVDPEGLRPAADRAAALLAELAGGEVLFGVVAAGAAPAPRAVTLRGQRLRQLLGVRLSTAEGGRMLSRLGFGLAADGADRLRVTVPSWRADVQVEVDLVEEVARLYGFGRIPAQLPPGEPGRYEANPRREVAEQARQVALAGGFSEAASFAFHSLAVLDRLSLAADHPWRGGPRVANPMTEDQAQLRASLCVGLLTALTYNARHRRAEAALFEVGRVFRAEPAAETGVAERLALGLGAYGAVHQRGALDFFALKGLIEALLARLGLDGWSVAAGGPELLHPGRAAELSIGGAAVGWWGELHPLVAANWDLPGRPVVGELDLEALLPALPARVQFRPWPKAPALRRDLACAVPEATPADRVTRTIAAAAGPLLASCELFDVYRGEGVAAGLKSLAFSLTYQADRTLTDAEVDERQDAVRAALAAQHGATLRS